YVCCNLQLNNLIEDTFETVKNVQGYSACNIARMANIIQEMFGHPFESVVALSDFAQNVHFAGDLVCKVEIDGKYMLTYATPYDADHAVESVDVIEDVPIEREERVDYEQKTGGNKEKAKKSKKSKKVAEETTTDS
ncbi:ground-like domain protein, partial [Ostertagia ostertagi]